MDFTYDSYIKLIHLLKENKYSFCSYHNWEQQKKSVILRHDIDNDIRKALRLAEIENKEGVSSTYFVLLTSNFYNVFSRENIDILKQINMLGCDIGLHFDETTYNVDNLNSICKAITNEADVLSNALGLEIKSVSMHRPSQSVLNANLKLNGLVNSYGDTYFKEFKYLSDSRRRWRESVEDIIKSKQYDRLHILTHAFWYNDTELSIEESIRGFVNRANIERYNYLKDNITDIDSILCKENVLYE